MSWLTDLCFSVIRMEGKALVAFLVVLTITVLLMVIRAPKRISYLLLLAVLPWLLVPDLLFSRFSVFNVPFFQAYAQHYSLPNDGGYVGEKEVAVEGSSDFTEARRAGLEPEDTNLNLRYAVIYYTKDEAGQFRPPATFRETYGATLAAVWLAGVAVVWGYGLISAYLLRRRVATATIVEKGVYESDQIQVPFILGFFRPVIYLPLNLTDDQRQLILCHERTHLRWKDPQIKVIAYLTMGLHWMNPLLWLWFYRFFLGSIELACDDDALRRLGEARKADYSEALLTIASQRQFHSAMTVAFGESWVKDRIKSALKYKKPWRFVTVLASLLAILTVIPLTSSGVASDSARISLQRTLDQNTGALRLELYYGAQVDVLTADLELWSGEGVVQRVQVLYQRGLPSLWRTGEGLSLGLNLSLNPNHDGQLDWALRFADNSADGAFPLPADYPYQALLTGGRDSASCKLARGESLTVPLGLLSKNPVDPPVWDAFYTAPEEIPLDDGQLALVARFRLPAYWGDNGFQLTGVSPEAFLSAAQGRAVLGNQQTDLSGRQLSDLLNCLQELTFTASVDLGSAQLDPGQLPCLVLTCPGSPPCTIKLLEDHGDLLLWNSATGRLTRLSGDPLEIKDFTLHLYRALGLSRSAREVLDLPETIGESAGGWTLLSSIPRQDIWLYRSDIDRDGLVLIGGACYRWRDAQNLSAATLSYQDFSGNGQPELAVVGSDTRDTQGQRLYMLSQFDPDQHSYREDWISPDSLGYAKYLAVGLGEAIGSDGARDYVYAYFYRDETVYVPLQMPPELPLAAYKEDTFYQVTYQIGQGELLVSADFYWVSRWNSKETNQPEPLPLVHVSSAIRWNAGWEAFENGEAFHFFNRAMSPIS